MFKFFHQFILVSMISIMGATFLLGYGYHEIAQKKLVDQAIINNQELIQLLSAKIWPDFAPYLTDLQDRSAVEIQLFPGFKDLEILVRNQIRGLNLIKVNIYALNGKIVFSSDTRLLGTADSGNARFAQAKSGQVSTYLEFHDFLQSIEGPKFDKNVLISFLPVFKKSTTQVEAVFEVYSDVSSIISSVEATTNNVYIYIALVLTAIFAVFLVFVKRTEGRLQNYITRVDEQNSTLHFQANHDEITGLPTKKVFYKSLDNAMQLAQQRERLLAVLFVDLDRLHNIDHTVGRIISEKLMCQVTQRLQECIRSGDTIARLCKSDFAIIMENVVHIDEVDDAAKRILALLGEQFVIDENELFITPSIGVVMYPFGDEDIDTLVKNANAAMRQAKDAGCNTVRLYCPAMSHKVASRFSLENGLRRALERDEFELHYQPFIQVKTGKVFGVEALIRWRSPELGLVPPLDFINILEETGLILPVGQWVLNTACQQAVKWQNMGISNLKVSVNISAIQLMRNNLTSQVSDAIGSSGLKSHLLDLELTESLLISDISNTIAIMDSLNEMGVSLSVDDFGTGYSSLSYLKKMPIETLKIDRSFVRDINVDADDAAIVDAICALSRSLRLKVIAEGVETHEQLDFLRNIGVDAVQGYLFSRPLPANELAELLLRDNWLVDQASVA